MRKVKVAEEPSIVDVIDLLSSLSEIDITLAIEKQDALKGHTLSAKWLSEAHIAENEELIRKLFKGVQSYLEQLVEKDPEQLKDAEVQRGVQALMTFVLEAADKIEKYTQLFKKSQSLETLADLQEYRDLQEYYTSAIAPHMPSEVDKTDEWEEDWGVRGSELTASHRRGLRSMSEIRSDKQYELLYLLKEDGKPFYDYDVLRHARMLYDFDKSAIDYETENLFYKISLVQDKECHNRALYVLKICGYLIDEFFKEALKHKESPFVAHVSMSIMGLMLAANPRNLKQTSVSEKTSFGYFSDFHYYLRKALISEEYQKLIMTSHERRPFQSCLFVLVHKLCAAYFSASIEHREMAAIIRRLISEGSAKTSKKINPSSLRFEHMLLEDEALRASLEKYPAGAIHKLAELFEKGGNSKGFDPLSQENFPEQVFNFTLSEKDVSCLRMPAPVWQEYIQKAELAKEFEGFLRFLSTTSNKQKLFFINLQDRTSWQDFARCTLLEDTSKKEEFYESLALFGLAKSTDFYHQSDVYFDQGDAKPFMELLEEQVLGGPQCGFYMSESVAVYVKTRLSKLVSMIHEACFGKSQKLSREERRDFIEITYLFLTLLVVNMAEADYVCFSDKDSLDAGAAMTAEWFGFCKMISGSALSEEDKGLFLYLMYAPALKLRERAIDKDRVSRTFSALEVLQKAFSERKALFQEFAKANGLKMKI